VAACASSSVNIDNVICFFMVLLYQIFLCHASLCAVLP
jgi:hypothetical protein